MLLKPVKVLLVAVSLMTCGMVVAAELEDDMDALAKNYGLFTKAQTADAAIAALEQMHKAATDAKSGVPVKLEDEPANSPKLKEFQAGIQDLIAEIDKATVLAKAGKLDEAKAEAAKMKETRDVNHKKFR